MKRVPPQIRLSDDNGNCVFCGQPMDARCISGTKILQCDCLESSDARYENFSRRRQLAMYKAGLDGLDEEIEKAQAYALKIRSESGLGAKFATRTFETFDRMEFENAYDAAIDFVNSNGQSPKNLIFYGGTGTGKTHLAAAIVNEFWKLSQDSFMFSTAGLMFDRFRDFENERKWTARYKGVTWLVLDDVGKEKPTEWNRERLFEVINSRYENDLSTVITTNLTLDELEKAVGSAVFSRLCEGGEAVEMVGEDRRTL